MGRDLPHKPLLNVAETAAFLGCTPGTLRNRIRAGTMTPEPVSGSKPPKWRYADLHALTGTVNHA